MAVSSGATETEIEIIGGGSNAWNPGDYIYYLNNATPLNGDFDVMVEVSRNDRPANTAGWANSGLMLRESVYVPGQEFTQDGTKVAMVANTTYIENSSPNRAGIPLWREEAGGGYGNGNAGFAWTTPIDGIKGYYLDERATDAAGTPDPEFAAVVAVAADHAHGERVHVLRVVQRQGMGGIGRGAEGAEPQWSAFVRVLDDE
ncbi:MAG: hypothetical protein U1G08_06735 [Verrucomicrobiota bacterium]